MTEVWPPMRVEGSIQLAIGPKGLRGESICLSSPRRPGYAKHAMKTSVLVPFNHERGTAILRQLGLLVVTLIFGLWQGRSSWLAHPTTRLAESGDSLLNAWILNWDYHALGTPGAFIWNAPNFYPTPNALAFSENLFGVL